MNREDRFHFIYTEVEQSGRGPEFRRQIQKMNFQDHHCHKDMLEKYEYAYDKIVVKQLDP